MANKEFQARHGLVVNTNLLIANVITGNVSVNGNVSISNTLSLANLISIFPRGNSIIFSANNLDSLIISPNTSGVLLEVINAAANVRVFSVSDTGDVFSNGNVGIGIATANLRLEVGGNMAVDAFIENSANIANSYTITTGRNAMSAGPITINSGVTVTVPSGSTWTIV